MTQLPLTNPDPISNTMADRKWSRVAAIALILLPVLTFFPEVVGLRVFFHHDLQFYFYPYHKAAMDILFSGHLPLWNRLSFGGMPMIGDGQSALFYPLNWLYLLIEASRALSIGIVLNFCVAAAGMWFFARDALRLRIGATCIATVAFTFNGFLVARMGHPSIMAGGSLVPWVFTFADRLLRGKFSARATIHLAIVITLQLISGHPQIPVYTAMAVFIYATVLCIASARAGNSGWAIASVAGKLATAYALGAALGAIQLLPWLELIGLSPRQANAPYEFTTADSLTKISWLFMLFPYAIGGMKHTFMQGGTLWDIPLYSGERIGYVGILPLVFAIYAVTTLFRRRRQVDSIGEPLPVTHRSGEHRLLAITIVAVFMLLFAAGSGTPFSRVIYALPMIGKLRCYARAVGVATFTLAALAGIGVERLFECRQLPTQALKKSVAAPIIAAVVLLVMFLVAWFGKSIPYSPDYPALQEVGDALHTCLSLRDPLMPNAYIPLILAGITLIMTITAIAIPRRAMRIAVGAMVTLTVVDMQSFAWSFAPTTTPDVFTATPDAVTFLRKAAVGTNGKPFPFRIAVLIGNDRVAPEIASQQLSISWAMPFGIEDINGFNSLQPLRALQLLFGPAQGDVSYGWLRDTTASLTATPANLTNSLNVRFVLVAKQFPGAVDRSWPHVFGNQFVDIYENPAPRGFAWFAKQVMPGLPDENVLSLSRSNALPPGRIALVDSMYDQEANYFSVLSDADPHLVVSPADGKLQLVPPISNYPPYDPPASLKMLSSSPNQIEFETQTTRPRFAVLSEPYFPGWECYRVGVDGSLDVLPIYRANYFFRGVETDNAKTRFEMFYRPHYFYCGLLITLVTGLGCSATLIRDRSVRVRAAMSFTGDRLRTLAAATFESTPKSELLIPDRNELRSKLTRALFVLAAACLGIAIQMRDGIITGPSIALLAIACLLVTASRFAPKLMSWPASWPAPDQLVIAITVPIYFSLLFLMYPAQSIQVSLEIFRPFLIMLAAAAVIAGTLASTKLPLGRWTFPLLLTLFIAMSVWTLYHEPNPTIDVFVFQRDAGEALINGHNPYAITFRNIYGDGAWVYSPEVQLHGRLLFGYPYMPLTLLFTTPFSFLFGDYRYAMLAAWAGSAVFIAYARPSRISLLAATLWLFTPRSFFIISNGWTEPIVVLMLTFTVFAACRWPRMLPCALGLFISSKQYLPAVFLIAPLLIARENWKRRERWMPLLIRTLATITIACLPMILWNPAAFWRSAMELQFKQPFRADSISFLAWLASDPVTGLVRDAKPIPYAAAISFLALIAGAAISLRKNRPTPAAFAGGVTLMFLLFFAFNKQAFANYYAFVIGAMWCTVAVIDDDAAIAPSSQNFAESEPTELNEASA